MLTRSDFRPYQERLVKHEKDNPFCAAWSFMGSGKTACTETAILELINSFDVRHALVVAPLRVARDVWDAEIETWSHLHGMTTSKIIGSVAERTKAMKTGADIHLINRENLTWLESFYLEEVSRSKWKPIKKWPWDMIVLDESQSFKSQSSNRYKTMRRIRRFDLASRIVELTGTPSPNEYPDLWSQFYILDKGERLGKTETAYRERWFDPPRYNGWTWTLKEGADVEIQQAVSDITLTLLEKDYLDLPDVLNNYIRVNLPPAFMKRYRDFKRKAIMETNGKTIAAVNAGALNNKLLQMANGAVYTDDEKSYDVLHDEKIVALLEVLDSLPSPVIIGYGFQSDRDRIMQALTKTYGKRKKYRVLKSAEDFAAMRNGQVDYAVMHPGSAGHGLNDLHLSGSEHIVWFGLTNNLEYYQQLNARLAGGHRRVGKNVVIHHILAADTIDEDLIVMLERKDLSQQGLMRATAARG